YRDALSAAVAADGNPRLDEGKNRPLAHPRLNGDLAPAAVQPEPLLGMLADPAFDDRSHGLRRARHVDLALGVAGKGDFVGKLEPEPAFGEADHAGAVHGTIDIAREPRGERIGDGLPSEKGHRHAALEILIDQ